jgi:cyclopropane-fatty-acyl-phospholipid synthase
MVRGFPSRAKSRAARRAAKRPHGAGPIAAVARELLLRRFEAIRGGSLEIRFPSGKTRRFGERGTGLDAAVDVRDESAFRRFVLRGDIAFGETYAEGLWTSPDLAAVTRLAARNVRLFDSGGRAPAVLSRVVQRLRHGRHRNSVEGSRENIRHHYDLGTDFYSLFLDPTLTYSCAVFDPPGISLEEAQVAKFDRIAAALELAPGDRLLEIGSGWGSFAIHAATRYGCRVTTTTISRAQHEHVEERIVRERVGDRVTLLLEDYRSLSGSFDKVVSIEMFEAVGLNYYDDYFGAVDRLLEPGGAMLLQTIWMNEDRFPRYRRQPDFIQRYIFPGSELASLAEIRRSLVRATGLEVAGVDEIGLHYAETLAAWRRSFLARLDRVRALGFHETFIRMWDYYLAYCEAGFAEGYIGDVQLLLTKTAVSRGLVRSAPARAAADHPISQHISHR